MKTMDSDNNKWRCIEGSVEQTAEHFEILYGDEGALIARVSQGADKTFVVQYEALPTVENDIQQAVDAVRKQIEYYLVELGEPDPWSYAVYHCGTMADAYSQVHWAHIPASSDRG